MSSARASSSSSRARWSVERGHDQQDAVGADQPAFVDLPGSSMKSLRSTGSADRGAGLAQVLGRALEIAARRSARRGRWRRRRRRCGRGRPGRNRARISPAEGEAFLISAIRPTPPLGDGFLERQAERPRPRRACWPTLLLSWLERQRRLAAAGLGQGVRADLRQRVRQYGIHPFRSPSAQSRAAAVQRCERRAVIDRARRPITTPCGSVSARPATINPAAAFSSTVSR